MAKGKKVVHVILKWDCGKGGFLAESCLGRTAEVGYIWCIEGSPSTQVCAPELLVQGVDLPDFEQAAVLQDQRRLGCTAIDRS